MMEEEFKRDSISGSGELLERTHQLAMEEYIQNQIDNEDTKITVITEDDKNEIKREVNVTDIRNNESKQERLIENSFAFDSLLSYAKEFSINLSCLLSLFRISVTLTSLLISFLSSSVITVIFVSSLSI
jgi:hypothetical protein